MNLPIMSPLSVGALIRALLLATLLLLGAPAAGNGTEESAQSQNLDYQAGLEAIKVSDWKLPRSTISTSRLSPNPRTPTCATGGLATPPPRGPV
jgi:hypothetical protein